jgi:hypothetical protein
LVHRVGDGAQVRVGVVERVVADALDVEVGERQAAAAAQDEVVPPLPACVSWRARSSALQYINVERD